MATNSVRKTTETKKVFSVCWCPENRPQRLDLLKTINYQYLTLNRLLKIDIFSIRTNKIVRDTLRPFHFPFLLLMLIRRWPHQCRLESFSIYGLRICVLTTQTTRLGLLSIMSDSIHVKGRLSKKKTFEVENVVIVVYYYCFVKRREEDKNLSLPLGRSCRDPRWSLLLLWTYDINVK